MNIYNPINLFKAQMSFLQPKFWGLVAGAVGTIAGSIIGSKGAKDAADTAADAQYAGISEQRRQFDITQEQMKPYQEAGLRGLTSYEDMMGRQDEYEGLVQSQVPDPFSFTGEDFQTYQDPGYQFRLQEGERSLNRSAAKSGGLASGARYRGLMDLNQQMASQEFGAARGRAYQDYTTGVASEQETYQRSLGSYGRQYTDPMSRYGELAGTGRATTTNLGEMRAGMAQNVSQSMGQAGAYQAAGTMGSARAWQQGLSSLGTLAGGYGSPNPYVNSNPYTYRPPGNTSPYGPVDPSVSWS